MKLSTAMLAITVASLGACKKAETNPKTPAASSELPRDLFLAESPANVQSVKQAKLDAKTGETVRLTGRIGGSKSPFVESRAMFTLVDASLPTCDDNPDDACPTPWDYCCEDRSDVAAAAATIQVVDSGGSVIPAGLEGAHGLAPKSTVVIEGTVASAEGGVLVISAHGIYVQP